MTPICPICKRPKIRRNGRYICQQAYCVEEERFQERLAVGKAIAGELSEREWQEFVNGQLPKEAGK